MKIFLTGATGYTGSIVCKHFVDAEYSVLALRRGVPSSSEGGVDWVEGDFSDGEKIVQLAARADAAIHIGASHDADMERLDRIVIDAIGKAYARSGKTFITTSATPVYGDTGLEPRDEHEPIENPHPLRAWRMRHDNEVVSLADAGVRGIVIRPGYIYGRAGGLLSDTIKRARETGKAQYIGTGENWTSTVHVDSLAKLYQLALENPAARGIYNAVSDEIVRSSDIVTAIAAAFGPGIEPDPWAIDDARATLGEYADLAIINCVASSTRARAELGWTPNARGMLSDILGGSYRNEPLLAYHDR